MTLEDRQMEAADEAIRVNYDFGDIEVEAIDWRIFTSGETERTANVFYADPEGGPSILGHATVKFEEGTDRVTEAYAIMEGVEVGEYNPPSSPAPGF